MLGALRASAIVVVATAALAAADPGTDKTRALALFGESAKAYKTGQFERAASLLREAYGLYPEPILLYNLARALEGLGDTVGAIAQYQRYLDAAVDIPDRAGIERRIAVMKEQLAAQKRADAPPPPPPPRPRIVPSTPLPVVIDTPRRASYVGPIAVIGVGVAALAGGAGAGVLAQHAHASAVAAADQLTAANDQRDATRYAAAANIAFVAGGALVATGAIWLVVRARQHRDTHVRVGAGSIAAAWSF